MTDPEVVVKTPNNISPELAGPANLVDYVHPPIGKVAVDIPAGDSAEDITKLVQLFQFPVPEANGKARKRLTEIGAKAVPALIEALGLVGQQDLQPVDAGAAGHRRAGDARRSRRRSPIRACTCGAGRASSSRACASRATRPRPSLLKGLAMENALDRASSAQVLGTLKVDAAVPELRELLGDPDPDVVRAAGLALGQLGAKDAADEILQCARARALPGDAARSRRRRWRTSAIRAGSRR